MFYNGRDFTIFSILMHAYARTAGRFSEASVMQLQGRDKQKMLFIASPGAGMLPAICKQKRHY
jgi:hypothetical protein